MHLNLAVGGVKNIFQSRNTLMQTFNQSIQPFSLRARMYRLSANCLQLRSVRRCCLGMHKRSVSSFAMIGRSGMRERFTLRCLEEWLLLTWRETMDSGRRWTGAFPSFGRWTPSSTIIFTTRLQKGRHVHATVLPINWKMWAKMLIWTPMMRSHRNCALPRLMSPVFNNG